MKKILLLSVFLLTLFTYPVSAQKEATPPGKEEEKPLEEEKITATEEKIKALKERVATKVAELKKLQKKVSIGQIKSLEENSLIIETKKGDETIMTDENTLIYRIIPRVGKKTIKLSDLEAGEKVAIFGSKDNLSEEITSRFIIARQLPLSINGVVDKVDHPGGTITIKTPKDEEFVVDVEVYTIARTWEKGKGLLSSGFSKIAIDDRVHISGVTNEKEEQRLTAHRILVLPGKAFGITQEKQISPSATLAPSPTSEE